MIVITGAAGFIGSYVASFLNKNRYLDLILVDRLPLREAQKKNIEQLHYKQLYDYASAFEILRKQAKHIELIIHLGACSSTMEFDRNVLDELNLHYSQSVWNFATEFQIPLIYASSAATYGDGAIGYSDRHELMNQYKPLNPYGESKHHFDLWALAQSEQPFFWAGLKFFNVYGPNEYHKGNMASVIYHTFNGINRNGKAKLFKSYREDCLNGEQKRDFLHVCDCAKVIQFLMEHRKDSGIYNVGAGEARSFNDLASATMRSMDLEPRIEYIEMPLEIRDKYQYYTVADMDKLRSIGYHLPFFTLEEGIDDYVRNYLQANLYF